MANVSSHVFPDGSVTLGGGDPGIDFTVAAGQDIYGPFEVCCQSRTGGCVPFPKARSF